ncbi:NAD(P)H-binding protein [Tenggerimyces flavus]|uniref:NAD(P)H-binding protein n=1 Tax=Tenggerimyces flavus TaxID=1708749 RepID=A0ABV7YK97_9ACTN|nr:NAD(P)H-binding protein [Tenggerimyces flavus]MBM7784849.1 uncharacterized protein YbjT (DUF2867 family) [Tenggerimyces flavus]
MTILITGATGNVGRPLVEQLLSAGHRVRALTRNPPHANLPAEAEVVAGDLGDVSTLAEAFAGVTALHLIGFGSDYEPLTNAPDIVDLAVSAGVQKATILRGDVEKGPVEVAVEASPLEWTFLSPVEFMANTLEWAETIKAEGVVREGFVTMRSAMVHEADIASVAAAVLTSDGHAKQDYFLTGPEALTPPEKVRTISEGLGRDIAFVELTEEEVVASWRAAGFSDTDVEYFRMVRTNPPEAAYTPLPTVEQVTGVPARTYAQWVKENAASFTR